MFPGISMYKSFLAGLLLATLALSACSVHKIDIQQGNIVTPDMLERLEPGMTKRQVEFIMGTPLIVNAFNGNQWIYFYRLQAGDDAVEQYHVILEFEDGKLSRIEDALPKQAGEAGPATGH